MNYEIWIMNGNNIMKMITHNLLALLFNQIW